MPLTSRKAQSNNIMKRNAAFQYYLSDGTCICDKVKITVEEAKQLFNTHYDGMVQNAKRGVDFQAGVWINGNSKTDYGEVLIQVDNPEVEESRYHGSVLCETTKTYFRPFK
jgi:hypothetical protein